MGQKCDGCNEEVSILLPIRIYEETKYGDELIQKWYCINCWEIVVENWKKDEEDEEEVKINLSNVKINGDKNVFYVPAGTICC